MTVRGHLVLFTAGAGLALAFPPFATGFIAFAGVIPLLYWLRNSSLLDAMQAGFAWGLGFNAAALYWICYSTIPGGIASIFLLTLFSMVVPLIYSFGYRYWGEHFVWSFPFLWIGWEYVRSFGELGFPWVILGNTQTYSTDLIQFISYTGIYGASFWICSINLLLFKLLESRSARGRMCWGTAILLFVLIPYIHGRSAAESYRESDDSLRISLVQGNIDPWAKWDKSFKDNNFQIYDSLSRAAGEESPDLIIWPESAAVSYLRYDARYYAWVKKIGDELNVPIFTGVLDAEFGEEREIFNAAFLIEPHSEELQSYAKMQLVPMSERFPFKEYIPEFFHFDFGQGPNDFSRGEKISDFRILAQPDSGTAAKHGGREQKTGGESEHRFGAVICYESVFSSLVREFCKMPIDFLVIITNDAWFGRSSGTYQHAQYAVLRAIEHRIPVARCANTGISMFIGPSGEILRRTPLEEEAVLTYDLPIRTGETFYTRYGDWFPLIITFIAACIILLTIGKAISVSVRRG